VEAEGGTAARCGHNLVYKPKKVDRCEEIARCTAPSAVQGSESRDARGHDKTAFFSPARPQISAEVIDNPVCAKIVASEGSWADVRACRVHRTQAHPAS
jgi:hypothetical protein